MIATSKGVFTLHLPYLKKILHFNSGFKNQEKVFLNVNKKAKIHLMCFLGLEDTQYHLVRNDECHFCLH